MWLPCISLTTAGYQVGPYCTSMASPAVHRMSIGSGVTSSGVPTEHETVAGVGTGVSLAAAGEGGTAVLAAAAGA